MPPVTKAVSTLLLVEGWLNNEKHLSDLVRIYDDMLLSTFWGLTVRKHINMYVSIHITDLCPWASEFLYFSLQMFYSTSTCKIASSIIFPLIMSFIYHITELPQICMKQNVLKVTRIKLILHIFSTVPPRSFKVQRTSCQPGCVGRRPYREWRTFLSVEVPRRITLCLNSPACHDKKEAYGWLTCCHAALA